MPNVESGTSARERRRQKNLQAILEEARKMILERGLEGLSLRELARRVDYSAAALYAYFRSKEELITAIGLMAMVRLGEYLRSVPTDLPPRERLVGLGLAYLEFAKSDPELFVRVLPGLPAPSTSWDDLLDLDSPYRILVEVIRRGIDAGEFKSKKGYSLEEIALSCWALVHGLAMLQMTSLKGLQIDFERIDRSILESFVRGLSFE